MTLSCSWHRLDAGTTGGAASRIRFMSHDMPCNSVESCWSQPFLKRSRRADSTNYTKG